MIKSRTEIIANLLLKGYSLRSWGLKHNFKSSAINHALCWVGNVGKPKGKTALIVHMLEQELDEHIYYRQGEKVC